MHAAAMEGVARADEAEDEGQTRGAGHHQGLSAQPVDEADGDEGEDQVDRAGDDDVEEDAAHAVARGGEDLIGVVEDDVDAAPLLVDGQDDADDEHLGQARPK